MTEHAHLETVIEAGWEDRASVSPSTHAATTCRRSSPGTRKTSIWWPSAG